METGKDGLWEVLELEKKTAGQPYVIYAVGAGGKTSFLAELAREARVHGRRVLLSTTTHIFRPGEYFTPGDGISVLHQKLRETGFAVAGEPAAQGKLSYPGDAFLARAAEAADLILLEADGSRGMPMKVPSSSEPVILPVFCRGTLLAGEIFVVNGLCALGRPPGEVCHRWQLYGRPMDPAADSGSDFRIVTGRLMAEVMESCYLKPLQDRFASMAVTPVLNQADDAGRQTQAEQILCFLNRRGLVLCRGRIPESPCRE